MRPDVLTAAVCALCGKPLDGTVVLASDGERVHEACESDYEDNLYFREFDE